MIPTNNHLTTEQLYDLLSSPESSDKPTLATSTHLYVCGTCRQELASLRSSLDLFRTAATNLAAAEMPKLSVQRTPSSPLRFAFRPQFFAASLATAAVLVVASASFIHPRRVVPMVPIAPAAAGTTVATEESDAELLNGIQQDLSASVPPSLAPLEVATAPR